MKPQRVEGGRALEVVVCLDDSVVDVAHLRTPGQVRAGTAPGCMLPLAPEALGGQTSVTLASLDETGQAYVARDLGAGGLRPLAATENVSLEHGKLRVFVRWAADGAIAVGGRFSLDSDFFRAVVGSTAACLAFVWMLTVLPPDARALSLILADRDRTRATVKVKPNEDPLQEREKGVGEEGASVDGGAAATAAAPGPQGKMGRDKAPNEKGRTAIKGDAQQDRPGPGDPRAEVREKGVLGVMRQVDWAPVTGGEQEWGTAREHTYGWGTDGPPGDGVGSWGSGYDGSGQGGCPPGAVHCVPGTIGTGRMATIGVSPGYDPNGTGTRVKLGPKGDHGPKMNFGPAEVQDDGLDKAIVKRYVQSKKEHYAYCYERELQVQEGLAGTVALEFVIAPGGNVMSVRILDNSVNATVGECVKETVRGIQFPRSEHMTKVKYPFIFRQAGTK
jgi:TonB family protein